MSPPARYHRLRSALSLCLILYSLLFSSLDVCVSAAYSVACECCIAGAFTNGACPGLPAFSGYLLKNSAACTGDPVKDQAYCTQKCAGGYSYCPAQSTLGGCVQSSSAESVELEEAQSAIAAAPSDSVCTCFCASTSSYQVLGWHTPPAASSPGGLVDCYRPCVHDFAAHACPSINSVGILQYPNDPAIPCSNSSSAFLSSASFNTSSAIQNVAIECNPQHGYLITDTASVQRDTTFSVTITLEPQQVAALRLFGTQCFKNNLSFMMYAPENHYVIPDILDNDRLSVSWQASDLPIFQYGACNDVVVQFVIFCRTSRDEFPMATIEFPYIPC